MSHDSTAARLLAPAFLAGPWDEEALVDRGAAALQCRPRWLRPLARRLLAKFPLPSQRRERRLRRFLADDFSQRDVNLQKLLLAELRRRDDEPADVPRPGLVRAERGWREFNRSLVDLVPFVAWSHLWPPPPMSPAGAAQSWSVPPLRTADELACWLRLDLGELDWFADRRSWERRAADGPLRHYRYRWLPKRTGGARLIEMPKWRLKCLQRRVLREILDRIPPHEAAHGFRRGRSIRSFAAPHVGQEVVIRLDLRDFFPTVRRARVAAIFMTAGYPEGVAELLAALCTNALPPDVWDAAPEYARRLPRAVYAEALYRQPHLPQGAPTSPALANLAAFRLDARLAGLARAASGTYTRYADDLAFSGGAELARGARRFTLHAAAIALEEGFAVEHRKTRIMRRGVRQHAAGVVLNARPNVARDEYDVLKATLANCVRRGPQSQNRAGLPDFRAHLEGRVAHVEFLNPPRGGKLRAWFQRIAWEDGERPGDGGERH